MAWPDSSVTNSILLTQLLLAILSISALLTYPELLGEAVFKEQLFRWWPRYGERCLTSPGQITLLWFEVLGVQSGCFTAGDFESLKLNSLSSVSVRQEANI